VSSASITASAIVTCSRAHGGQRPGGEPGEPVGVHQVASLWAAVVIEHGLDALLPLAALRREGVAQPHPRAQIENVFGRDPRLRQPAGHQQLAKMPGVRTIALRTPFRAAPCCRLGRLGEMHPGVDRAQLLDSEPPACRGLQRHLELLAAKAVKEPSDSRAVGWPDPRARDLAGRRVDPLRGYLRSVLIESH
jgi:hypothetical protein